MNMNSGYGNKSKTVFQPQSSIKSFLFWIAKLFVVTKS